MRAGVIVEHCFDVKGVGISDKEVHHSDSGFIVAGPTVRGSTPRKIGTPTRRMNTIRGLPSFLPYSKRAVIPKAEMGFKKFDQRFHSGALAASNNVESGVRAL
jgi:hypothetical protein